MFIYGNAYIGAGVLVICFVWILALIFIATKLVVSEGFRIRDVVFGVFAFGVIGSALTIFASAIFLVYGDPSRMHLVQEAPLLRLQLPDLENETFLIRERTTESDRYRFIEQDTDPDDFEEVRSSKDTVEVQEGEGLAPVKQTWALRVVCVPTDWLHEFFGSCFGQRKIIIFQIPEGGLWEKTQIATSSPS